MDPRQHSIVFHKKKCAIFYKINLFEDFSKNSIFWVKIEEKVREIQQNPLTFLITHPLSVSLITYIMIIQTLALLLRRDDKRQ